MTKRYLRMADLASVPSGKKGRASRVGRYPVGQSTIHRWVAEGKFPAATKLNGTACWPEDVIEAWEREQAAAPDSSVEQRKLAAAASVLKRREKRDAEAKPEQAGA